ncbi:DoxX family protein [Paraflavisolibacter sp. H34]|uniref:DoxX family protein n=1 Tax=Huijunlia imazamoxiresistens TaxID=3127457 RepID=UPI0030189359
MKQILFSTSRSWSPVIIRVLLGLVLGAHGAQKLFGLFGGYGFEGTMNFFTGTVGLPPIVGLMVIVIEFFGSLSLLAGLATRLWSASMVFLFLGIVFTSHLQNGFFMNWFGNQKGEGYEFFILAIGMAASLVLSGAGAFSADRLLFSVRERKPDRPFGARTATA